MLVIEREMQEIVMIDDNIEVRVVSIRGDKVRLGFSAPDNVIIHRREIWEKIRREKREGLSHVDGV